MALWQFTRDRHLPPARPTPRLALWLHDPADARELARALEVGWPGLHLALDPLHDPARPTPLAELLRRPAHPPMVADEVKRLLYGEPLLIHVVQPRGQQHRQHLDALLLAALADLDYHHVLLYRRHPPGPEASVAAQWRALSLVGELMRARGLAPEVMALDGHGPQAQPAALLTWLQGHLGPPATASLPSMPSTPRRPALQHWPSPREGQAAYRFNLERVSPPVGELMLDPLDEAHAAGTDMTLTGLAVPQVDLPDGTRLVLLHGERQIDAAWGRPSPGGPHHFPGHPQAARARFGPVDLPVDPQQPCQVCWQAPGQAPKVMATLHWRALTDRLAVPGALWSDAGLGFLPMPGTGSFTVIQAIERALGTPSDTLPAAGRPPTWRVDISGAAQRFAVVAEPVRRFQALCASLAADDKSLAPLAPHERVQAVIERLDREPDRSRAAWADRFTPQTRLIARARPLQVLSWHAPAAAQEWLSQRLGVAVSLPPRRHQPTRCQREVRRSSAAIAWPCRPSP